MRALLKENAILYYNTILLRFLYPTSWIARKKSALNKWRVLMTERRNDDPFICSNESILAS